MLGSIRGGVEMMLMMVEDVREEKWREAGRSRWGGAPPVGGGAAPSRKSSIIGVDFSGDNMVS